MNEFLRPSESEKLNDEELLAIADETRLWEEQSENEKEN